MKRLASLVLLALLVPGITSAAIAFDAAADLSGSGTSPFTTAAFAVTGSTNTLVLVSLACPTGSDCITGVTWGGVAMTEAASHDGGTGSYWWDIWYMTTTTSSTANKFVVTFSGAGMSDAAAASYTGAASTGIPDATGGGSAVNAVSLTVTVNTVADNTWLYGTWGNNSNCGTTACDAGANTTRRSVNAGQATAQGDTNGAETPPGPFSMTIGNLSNANWGSAAISFKPFVVAPAITILSRNFLLWGNW